MWFDHFSKHPNSQMFRPRNRHTQSARAGDGDGGAQVSNALGGQAEEGVHERVANGVEDGHPDQLAPPFAVQPLSGPASYGSAGLLGRQRCVDEQWRRLVDAPDREAEPRPELEVNLKRAHTCIYITLVIT